MLVTLNPWAGLDHTTAHSARDWSIGRICSDCRAAIGSSRHTRSFAKSDAERNVFRLSWDSCKGVLEHLACPVYRTEMEAQGCQTQ